ncbi:MAG: carboxypeptidase M32 [Thermoplasmata archaeon]|nr:carboxypeptidase M32 [Thermoplasmata archaeon]
MKPVFKELEVCVMEESFKELKEMLAEITDIGSAAAVLGWDQAVNMPPGGAPARGRQLAALGKVTHEKLINPRVGELLKVLQTHEQSLDYNSNESSLIRNTRIKYNKAVNVPTEFAGRWQSATSESFDIWLKARPANNFKMVEPYLKKNFDMCKEYAEFFPGYEHPLDPMMDNHDYGMKASNIREIFSNLRKEMVPIVESITSQEPADDSFMKLGFEGKKQLEFGESVVKAFGYDFNRGRQDMAPHPFTISFALGDVRITTRIQEHFLGSALFGTLHEAGHAMYEQGGAPSLDGTPLRGGTSIGVHESQSRLWENIVGRSRPFWQHYYPGLQKHFPEHLGNVELNSFYRGINKVQKSLIRVEADEVTYNLHVMMRFDFECSVLEGSLDVSELPEAWKDRMESDIGIRPKDDADGVMQDIHWYNGIIGYFQGYTLGNIMSAQFYDAAVKEHPEITEEIGQGKFSTLHDWLKQNIYQHGSKFTANELLERVTGNGLDVAPYINYLKKKYGELYDL